MKSHFVGSGAPVSQSIAVPAEALSERGERRHRERAVVAQARADFACGNVIELHDLESWLDALERDIDAPLPRTAAARAT